MVLGKSSDENESFIPDKKLVIKRGVKTKEDFFAEMKRLLKLADWFGANYDAFNDVLRGGCGQVDPVGKVFVWEGSAEAKQHLGGEWDTIFEIFKDDDDSGHEAFVVELM